MLILTRRIGEVLCIGPDVQVEILGIKNSFQVRIGIRAPQQIAIDRLEIRQKKDAEKAS